jgi:hypothetical protein
MADFSPPEPVIPDFAASEAANAFSLVAQSENVVENVCKGLHYVLQIAVAADMTRVPEPEAQRLANGIVKAGPIFARSVDGKFSAELAKMGMMGALGLALLFGKTKDEITSSTSLALVLDHIDYVKVLMAEIKIAFLLEAIAQRGDAFRGALAGHRSLADLNSRASVH